MAYQNYETLWGTTHPATFNGGGGPLSVWHRVHFTVRGRLLGLRYLRDVSDNGEHLGLVRELVNSGIVRTTPFKLRGALASGPAWQSSYFDPYLAVAAGSEYLFGMYYFDSALWYTTSLLANTSFGHLNRFYIPQDSPTGFSSGFFNGGIDYPNQSFQHSGYGIDVIFWDGRT